MDNHRNAIHGNDIGYRIFPFATRSGQLFFFHGPGGIANIAGSINEGRNPYPRTATLDRNFDLRVPIHKNFSSSLGDGQDRGGTLHADRFIRGKSIRGQTKNYNQTCQHGQPHLFKIFFRIPIIFHVLPPF